MTLLRNRLVLLIGCLLLTLSAQAETIYVTDRILLGVHQQPNEQSPVITSVNSGTPLTVLVRADNFIKVRTPDNQEGWVSSRFVNKDKPATAEVDSLQTSLAEEQAANKKLTTEMNRLERELQVQRDEASNAKTAIKELQDALKRSGAPEPPQTNEELNRARAEITALQEKIAALEKEKTALTQNREQAEITNKLQQLDDENQSLKVRIEAALANLKGEKVPTTAELAAIRPKFPFWYWLILAVVLAIGAGIGIYAYDHMNRKRHGGFRL